MKQILMIMVMMATAFISKSQETNFTGKVKDEQGKPSKNTDQYEWSIFN